MTERSCRNQFVFITDLLEASAMIYEGRRSGVVTKLWAMLNTPLAQKHRIKPVLPQMMEISGQPKQLADRLISIGACDEIGVNRAWLAAQKKGKRFEDALARLSVVSEQKIAEACANILRLPLAKATDIPIAPLFREELRACFLRQARCCPLRIDDGCLVLGMVDGFDEFTPKAVSAKIGLPVSLSILLPVDFEIAFARLYSDPDAIGADPRSSFGPTEEDLDVLDYDSDVAFVIKHVDDTITAAVEAGASDIHFETFDDRLNVRFRHDGVLHDADTLPASLAPYFISRAKVMAKLDIAEKRLPQDGGFKLSIRGTEVGFRLSTMPSLHGEKAVLRILDGTRLPLTFDALGLERNLIERWSKCLASENGILLVVGPTGSGKSTTLYTSLQELSTGRTNIATVEDPIEYRLNGINQTQVKPQIGLTFASALRSMLRQDPDVIMIGEIRDLETATIAVQAAMTGHLVLSTLHTKSAAAAITRLRDIGLQPYAIASVIRGIAAQRLLRKLCDCKRESRHSINRHPVFASLVREQFGLASSWEPVGCVKCRGTGYNGRFAIAELIVPSSALRALIAQGASQGEIDASLEASGAQSLFDLAQDAVGRGLTGVDEVASLYETT